MAPTDLVTSDVTHYSFRATWNGPEDPVEKYRIEYFPVSGGQTEQVSYSSPEKLHSSKQRKVFCILQTHFEFTQYHF